jgi:excisionase family DNA binding protein
MLRRMTQCEPGYFTKEAARTYSNLSLRTIEYAIARGKLRAYRVGEKRVLIAREDLDRFIRQREVGADLDKIANETVAEVLGG